MERRIKPAFLVLYYTLQWTWGIIPNLLGLIIFLFLLVKNPARKCYRFFGAQVTEWNDPHGSMAVGMFIFLGHHGDPEERQMVVHEYGHTWQSVLLGPLFLLIIGLPSFLWAALPVFHRLRVTKRIRYVDFYPEAWANRWGTKVTGLPAPDR